MTRSLGKTEHEDENRQRENQRRPERKRSEQFVRLGGQQKNAAADDGIDAHRHQPPEPDGPDQFLSRIVWHEWTEFISPQRHRDHRDFSLRPQCLCASYPRPRSPRPGSAFVIAPSRRTGAPLMITSSTPSLKWCGSSYVEISRIFAGSKTTTSAFMPGRRTPRSVRFVRSAACDVALRTASSSVKRCSSRT